MLLWHRTWHLGNTKVQPIRAQDLGGSGPMRVLHSGVDLAQHDHTDHMSYLSWPEAVTRTQLLQSLMKTELLTAARNIWTFLQSSIVTVLLQSNR